MWKVKCVQVSTERGALLTSQGSVSRLSVANGWAFELHEREIVAEKEGTRLRIPRDLLVIEEEFEHVEPVEQPKGKRSREAA